MARTTVDVVIPVHGHWELTERCLDSLRHRDPCVRSVIVVDDASPDDSAARLRQRDDVVAVILEQNAGFAAACNAGANRATADAIFFLNNDTLVEPGTIQALADVLDAEDDVAAVGPKLVHGDGTLQAAGLAMIAGRINFERLLVYLDGGLPEGSYAYDPLALSGAALLVRRRVFDEVGQFDEGYRNGYEDVDLCVQLWAHGHRLRYEPRATIVHLEGASRGKVIDDGKNERRFATRWGATLGAVPRYAEPPPPVLAVTWRSANPLEEAVRANFREPLRRHAGARVVWGGGGVGARALAALGATLDRRPLLRVAHGTDLGAADVVWEAPPDESAARTLARSRAARIWVPSNAAAERCIAAGVAPERISIVRPGWPSDNSPQARALTAAVVVASRSTQPALLDAIRSALAPLPHEVLVAEESDAAAVERLRSTPLAVFADRSDPWGLLGSAALAGGALVVALGGSPFLEVVPDDTYVGVATSDALAAAVREIVAAPAAYLARGPRARREMARRIPDVYAGRRIRELGRAFVHGTVDPRTLTITPQIARTVTRKESA